MTYCPPGKAEKRLLAPLIPQDLSGVNNSEKRRLLKKQKAYAEQCKEDLEDVKYKERTSDPGCIGILFYCEAVLANASFNEKRIEDALKVPTRRR